MPQPLFKMLDCSKYRNVFVCGDIHGEYSKLEAKLKEVGFDPETDLLISVGDLVDRGPESERFEEFISKPWFKRVLGNHDLQPREFLLGYEDADNVRHNGGQWFLDKPREEQERIASLLEDAPLALEVATPAGRRIGVTHADMLGPWVNMVGQLADPDINYRTERNWVNCLTGSREIITAIRNDPNYQKDHARVGEIDYVFHGHTPIAQPLICANRIWIDTGACSGGDLTVCNIDATLNVL